MDVDGTLAFARWVYFLSVMILFGSALFPFYALDRTAAPALAAFAAICLRSPLVRADNVDLALEAFHGICLAHGPSNEPSLRPGDADGLRCPATQHLPPSVT